MCYKYIFNTQEKMNIVKESVEGFSLKQVTPMIHFQGEEKSAGIRASDLKPRFDAFLKRYWYGLKTEREKTETESCILKQNEEGIENSVIDERERISFDYKVKILNKGCKNYAMTFYKEKKNDKNSFYGSFYGELKDNKFSFYDEIVISFLSPHQDLRNQIKELFPVFLSVNGFGLRNNKGYGYFKLKGKTKEETLGYIQSYQSLENKYIEQLKAKNKEKGVGVYQLQIENKEYLRAAKVQNLLEDIKIFHQILKSGFNFKNMNNYNSNHNRYIPSFVLKKYKKQEGVLFEKKSLKLFLKQKGYKLPEDIKNDGLKEDEQKDLNNQKLYIRGLLGLAPFYEFRNVKKEDGSNLTVRFNVKIEEVERFPSPIKYLPISDEEIIILVDYSKIEEFRKKGSGVNSAVFSLDEVERRKVTPTSLRKNLQIPDEEQYSIHQLFKQDGVIADGIKAFEGEITKITRERSREWKYSVISDIEIE